MGYVFISYSSKNLNIANAMRELLNSKGIPTWMAPNDIPAGSKYAQVINRSVKESACFLLLLSNDAQNSPWVSKEVERAVNYRKPIFPVQIEKVELNDEFEFYISTDQIIAIQKVDEESEEMKNIIKSLLAIVGDKNYSKAAENTAEHVNDIGPMSAFFNENPDQDPFIYPDEKDQTALLKKKYPEYSGIVLYEKGLYSTVYTGYDLTKASTKIAIKAYSPSSAFDTPLFSHYSLFCDIQGISQENIGKLISFDLSEPVSLVMEYIEGTTLEYYLNKGLKTFEICEILLGILSGLMALHEKNIFYGDLNPRNIIISNQLKPVLIDFSESNYNGSMVSDKTLRFDHYRSPEKDKEHNIIDFRSDIYEFGIIVADFLHSVNDNMVYRDMVEIVGKCTKKNPDERYSSVAEIITLINNLIQKSIHFI